MKLIKKGKARNKKILLSHACMQSGGLAEGPRNPKPVKSK